MMMMERLFDIPAVAQERSCGTCAHAAQRHGTHARGTYPLVCLVMACPVSASYEGMAGRKATDWPCKADFDELGPFPRGWEAKPDGYRTPEDRMPRPERRADGRRGL